MVGVAGARGGDSRVKGMAEEIPECDAGRAGFDGFEGGRAFKHARLCGHEEEFNTEGAEDTESAEKNRRRESKKGRCVRPLF